MRNTMLYCFLDTNIFLQFNTFDEINWLDELKVKEVCLVIPLTVIQELDKHKTDSGSQRRSKRSRMVLPKISEYFETEDQVIRPNVAIKVLLNNPERQWLINNSFDPE